MVTGLPLTTVLSVKEPAAPAVIERLRRRGVGVEAGLASVADAERLVALNLGGLALRMLIEVSEQDVDEALSVGDGIEKALNRAGVRRPMLVHGFDATVWRFVALAAERRWSTRVGLEDGKTAPNGATAANNAALVAAAAACFKRAYLR